MLQPVGGSDAADHPYIFIGMDRTNRVNADNTFTEVANINLQSALYGVQFVFTILASTWDKGGAPPLEAERTNWVDAVCAYPHVVGFRSEQDQGPDRVLYNYGRIIVGPEGSTIGDEVTVRMDHLNAQSTFAMIDAAWGRMQAAGATDQGA